MASTEELKQPKYVDFAEYILFQVRRTQSLIRQTDIMLLASGAAVVLLSVLFGFILIDHWAFSQGMPSWLRWTGFVSLWACLGTACWIFYRTAGSRNVSSLFAARTLERADQGFANNLLTLVDLDHHGRSSAAPIRKALEKRAALRLNDLDVEETLDRSQLLKRLYALIAVTVILFGYAFLSPKSTSGSTLRILLPWTEMAAPTETRIFEVKPGNANVTSGAHVEVSAYVEGKIPEKVWLIYSTADRRIVDEKVEMQETEEGIGKYTGIIAGENGRGVDQTTSYSLHAGDAQTQTYVLEVTPAPHAAIETITIEPPEYTGRESYEQPAGSIDGLEGSLVKLMASTNIPVEKAWIQLYNSEDITDRAGQLPLTVSDKTSISGEWPLKIRDDGTYPRYYSVECETADGSRDPSPPMNAILIRPDERPLVRLLSPKSDLSRAINVPLPLVIEARDPDYKLSALSVQVEKQGQIIQSELIDAEGKQSLRMQHELDFERLPVSPGETLTFWVEARDNREPNPNRRQTTRLRVKITEPVSEEEARKQKEEEKQTPPAETPPEQKPDQSPREMPEEQSQDKESPEQQSGEQEGEEGETAGEKSGDKKSEQKSADEGKQDGERGEEDSDKGNSESGEGKQEPEFSPEGSDDDLVLEKMIERMKEEQQSAQDDQKKPDRNNDPSPDEPDAEKQEDPSPDKSEQKENENQSDESEQSGDNPMPGESSQSEDAGEENSSDKNSESRKPSSDGSPGESDIPAEESNETENETPPANSDSLQQEEGNSTEQPAGEMTSENNSRETSPTDNQNNSSTNENENSSNSKADPNADPQGEKQRGKKPGEGESKPGTGSEEGPTERDENQNMDAPQAENELDRPKNDSNPGSNNSNSSNSQNSPANSSKPEPSQQNPNNQSSSDQNSGNQNSSEDKNSKSTESEQMKPSNKSSESPNQPSVNKTSEQDPNSTSNQPSGETSKEKPTNEQMQSDSDQKPTEDSPKPPGKEESPQQENSPSQNGKGQTQDSNQNQDSSSSSSSQSEGESNSQGSGQGSGKSNMEGKTGPKGDKPGTPSGQGPSSEGTAPTEDQEAGSAKGGMGNADNQRPGNSKGGSGTSGSPSETDYSMEDRRKAAELVLNRIEEDLKRGEVDQELLDELNWTEDNLKQFQQRMSDYLRNDSNNETSKLKQQQFNEMLKNMRLEGKREIRQGPEGGREAPDEFAPSLTPAPPEYRELEEAFRRSLNEAGNASD